MIEVTHITKSFKGKKALDSVSLRVGSNETVCIIGSMGSGKSTLLRCIAGLEYPEHGMVTIDGNPLNCLKSNLRICTEKENSMNHKIQSNNTSGCSGVTFRKDTNKWTVSIQVGYKVYRLGCYNSKEEAIRVRKEAEIKYFGEYRRKE